MKCIDTMRVAGTTLCLAANGIYVCDECKDDECEGCKLIPKPKFETEEPQEYQTTYSPYYGDTSISNFTDIIKTKEFLFGLGAGLLLGAFLFRK